MQPRPSGLIFFYGLVLAVLYVVNTVLPVRVSGVTVELFCCVPAAIALFEGPVLGMAFGAAAGLCLDMALTGVEGLYPLYLLCFGVVAGLLAERFLQPIFASMLLLTLGAVLGLAGFRLLGLFVFQRRFDLLLCIRQICGQALVTAAFSPFVYLPIRTLYRRAPR